jgi:ribonuclease G
MGKYKNEKKTLDDIEGELLSYKEEAAWIELSPLLSFNRKEMEKWKEEQGIELYLTEGGELTPFYRFRHIGSREEVEKRIKENKAEFLF